MGSCGTLGSGCTQEGALRSDYADEEPLGLAVLVKGPDA